MKNFESKFFAYHPQAGQARPKEAEMAYISAVYKKQILKIPFFHENYIKL